MSGGETAIACIGVAAGLCLIATYGFDAWHKHRTRRRFQRRAAEVARDVNAAKARYIRLKFDQIIAAEYPAQLPHQTRRTEDNQ